MLHHITDRKQAGSSRGVGGTSIHKEEKQHKNNSQKGSQQRSAYLHLANDQPLLALHVRQRHQGGLGYTTWLEHMA